MRVKLFAGLRDKAGAADITVPVHTGATVAELQAALRSALPDAEALLASSRVAVNLAFASPDTVIQEGDEVAVIPPVSGG